MNRRIVLFVAFVAFAQIAFFQTAFAQTIKNTQNSFDYSNRSNATVDPISQALQLEIPLGSYPQRGGNLPVALNYSSKLWQLQQNGSRFTCVDDNYYRYAAVYGKGSKAGWTSRGSGISIGGATGDYYNNQAQPTMTGITSTIARLFVVLPNGSRHELRKDDNVYQGAQSNIGGKYYAIDGSKLIYDRDAGILYLPDGSKYQAGTYTDRNGNQYVHSVQATTDSLGRTINNPLSVPAGEESGAAATDQTYALPGMGGNPVNYKLYWRKLSDAGVLSEHETDQTLKYEGNAPGGCLPVVAQGASLFASSPVEVDAGRLMLKTATIFDPVVLHKIELSNGQTYTFKYNVYGEVTKVIYPTGAYERFVHAQVAGVSGWFDDAFYGQVNRGVVKRWVSPDGTTQNEVQYSYDSPYNAAVGEGTRVITNPDGTKTEYRYHRKPSGESIAYGFDNPLYGKITEERYYAANGALMKRKLYEWVVDGTVTSYLGKKMYKTRNPRVIREVSVVFEPNEANALASMSETDYDSNGDPTYFAVMNPKATRNYHYVVLAASTAQTSTVSQLAAMFSGSQLANISETDYLYDANYKARGILTLPTATRIKDAAGTIKAQSQILYDEGNFPTISAGTATNWIDPVSSLRGNVTTTRVWDNSNNSWLETHAQYDNFGNQRKSWDAKGNLSETEYSATYQYAYPTKAITPAPDPSGQNGSSVPFQGIATYDFNTGLTLTSTDANGQTTQMEYNDLLLRPTRFIPPSGGSITEMIYNDVPGNLWVKTKSQIDGTNWAESTVYLDGLGKTKATQKKDSQGDVFVETLYDLMGRVKQVTNPFRNGETKLWTTTNYDDAGRMKEVITPDGAKIETFSGLSISGKIGRLKTVIDQAGRKRSGISDALGRTVRVIEDPSGQNLATDYVFDTLGNLSETIQGEQHRYFLYNSLGRLLRARQPEQDANPALAVIDPVTGNSQWSVAYAYDNNGNINSTTDARGVTVAGTYDNLNRLVVRDYSDMTPDVFFKYDDGAVSFSKGKMTQVASSVSTSKYTAFDNLGRIKSSQQLTGGQTYNFSDYSYNLAGQLVSQVYPSGRIVTNQIDTDGDLAQVNGSFGGVNKTYAGNVNYTSAGAVSAMQLGNGRWESAQFNSRLQVTQLGLGTSSASQDLLQLNYDYGMADNNGAVKSHQITVQGQFQAHQTYAYDGLNRLQSSQEVINSQLTWKQTFLYDRYGNRKFDAAQTTTLGGCPQAVCNPDVSTANNRLVGYGFDQTGNVTQDAENKLFSYDAENRQKEVRDAQNNVVGQYLYDGEGRRVQKTAAQENTVFVYDALGKMIAEYAVSGFQPQTPQTRYLTSDTLGSPRVITDQTGNIVSRHDYLAFGEEISRPNYGTDSVRDKYTGYERDNESELDYAQTRYYNSKHGRFTSVDPLTASATIKNPQTFNRYSYGLNSPYKFTDPLGLRPQRPGMPEREFGAGFAEELADYEQRLQNTIDEIADNWAAHSTEQQDKSRVEPPNSDPIQAQQEVDLASILSDETGVVSGGSDPNIRGNSVNGQPTHYVTGDGKWHTIHIYGADRSGNTDAKLYVPSGFTAKYEGGLDNQVVATNKKTGEVIVYAHVKGVNSQKQLTENMKTVKNNGSRYIGKTGGLRGSTRGNMHAHVTIYKNAQGRESIRNQLYGKGNGVITDQSGYSDFRTLIPKR